MAEDAIGHGIGAVAYKRYTDQRVSRTHKTSCIDMLSPLAGRFHLRFVGLLLYLDFPTRFDSSVDSGRHP